MNIKILMSTMNKQNIEEFSSSDDKTYLVLDFIDIQ